MSFVIREIGKIIEKVNDLDIPKKEIDIFIYPEYDFEAFYKKHCERTSNDNRDFTVLVEDNIKIPAKNKIRNLIENALKNKRAFVRKDMSIIVEIEKKVLFPTKFKVRRFSSSTKSFLNEHSEGLFRFRDIEKINGQKKIRELFLKKELTEEEYKNIDNLWVSSFNNPKPNSEKVRYIYLIGHTDIIKI